MLTGKMVRVRYARDRIVPYYLDLAEPRWLAVSEQLLALFRQNLGRTRGELEEEIRATFGDDPGQLVHQGLAKLLQDRCEFEVASGQPPEQVRQLVFQAAARARLEEAASTCPESLPAPFDRAGVLDRVAIELKTTVKDVEASLFADLKSEQRLTHFKDLTAQHLLQRYNVALAQAILLRASKVHVTVRGETPRRFRALFRRIKFHRLLCEVERLAADSYQFHLDGPLSLFSSTSR